MLPLCPALGSSTPTITLLTLPKKHDELSPLEIVSCKVSALTEASPPAKNHRATKWLKVKKSTSSNYRRNPKHANTYKVIVIHINAISSPASF